MINTKVILFYDFETGSVDKKTTQPLELAAVAICPRKLEIIPNSLFHSRIKPLSDEDAVKAGLTPVQKGALDKNKLNLEELQNWPSEKIVWGNFCEYTYQWNPKKDSWNALLSAGFNNKGFDNEIINRLAEWYGPWDKKKNQQKIFNPIQTIDLKDICWLVNENNPEIDFNSMDAVRDWLGIDKTNAHTATQDVLDGAMVLTRMMRFIRHWSSKTKFKM